MDCLFWIYHIKRIIQYVTFVSSFFLSIMFSRFIQIVERIQLSSVQLLSRVRLFVIPWTAACQASLSIANSWSLLKLMSIELVMPSSHLILCCPLLLLPTIPPSIRVFSNESTLRMRWPKYWSIMLGECYLRMTLHITVKFFLKSCPAFWELSGYKNCYSH